MIETQFLNSLLVAIFVGGAGGYLGSLMITKKMALSGDALGHLALPGIAIGLLYNLNLTCGAFITLALGILFIWRLEIKTKITTEALTGIVFTTSTAAAFLFLKESDLERALIGDITSIGRKELVLSVIMLCAVYLIIRAIYKDMILASLSEDLAKVEKVKINRNNLVFLLSVAVIVALGIKVVGSLLIGALVIIPAATAKNISRNMRQYSYGGAVFGILGGALGMWLYKITGLPAGPLIILTSTLFFVISVALRTGN